MSCLRVIPVLTALILAVATASPLAAAVYFVDRGDDSAAFTACNPAVPADCTLRGAIIAANANPGADAIRIDYSGPFGRLLLLNLPRSGDDSPQEGDLDITDDLLIDGVLGLGAVILAGGAFNDRVFDIALGVAVTLDDLLIVGGSAPGNESGGGIRSAGSDVRLIRVEVRDSMAFAASGIMMNGHFSDTMLLDGSAVTDNYANQNGGGIFVNSGSLTLQNSTISGNHAGAFGGALFVNQVLARDVSLEHVTITDNTSNLPSPDIDIYLHDNYGYDVEISGSVIDSGCYDPNGRITSLGGNLEGPGDTCGFVPAIDQVGVAGMSLDPLAPFPGVMTRSHRPSPSSPAVDNPQIVPASCPMGDQRLQARPQDGDGDGSAACDSGAVEAPPLVVIFADGFESGSTGAWSSAVP